MFIVNQHDPFGSRRNLPRAPGGIGLSPPARGKVGSAVVVVGRGGGSGAVERLALGGEDDCAIGVTGTSTGAGRGSAALGGTSGWQARGAMEKVMTNGAAQRRGMTRRYTASYLARA